MCIYLQRGFLPLSDFLSFLLPNNSMPFHSSSAVPQQGIGAHAHDISNPATCSSLRSLLSRFHSCSIRDFVRPVIRAIICTFAPSMIRNRSTRPPALPFSLSFLPPGYLPRSILVIIPILCCPALLVAPSPMLPTTLASAHSLMLSSIPS